MGVEHVKQENEMADFQFLVDNGDVNRDNEEKSNSSDLNSFKDSSKEGQKLIWTNYEMIYYKWK